MVVTDGHKIAPKFNDCAPLAVAFALSVIDVGPAIDAMVVAAGMPVPNTVWPIVKPEVEDNPVTEFDPLVKVPVWLL